MTPLCHILHKEAMSSSLAQPEIIYIRLQFPFGLCYTFP